MNSDLARWDDAAPGWDKTIAQKETFRTILIEDALNRLLPDVNGLDVLDAGCGNGYFSNWLSTKGAKVSGIDGSKKLVEIARLNYPNLQFEIHDLLKPLNIKDSNFDMILGNMLLMHMEDISVFLKEAKRLLRPNGKLIVSVLHPCFNEPTSKLFKTLWQKLTLALPVAIATNYYNQNLGRFESHFKTNLTHYHRTLEEYSQQLNQAGFAITRMIEPHKLPQEFLSKNPKLEYAQRLPRFIFFECQPI
jgi:2-polyprenyl-3-methyl-5-hydroxy-6-metoxy-1,4-benzoquinol methylase